MVGILGKVGEIYGCQGAELVVLLVVMDKPKMVLVMYAYSNVFNFEDWQWI